MNEKRRSFIRALGSVAVAVPLIQFPLVSPLRAAEGERLDPDAPEASALAYTHESGDPDRRCSGCQFFTGAGGEEWGPCVIFPGKLVSANGHCTSWFQRAG